MPKPIEAQPAGSAGVQVNITGLLSLPQHKLCENRAAWKSIRDTELHSALSTAEGNAFQFLQWLVLCRDPTRTC